MTTMVPAAASEKETRSQTLLSRVVVRLHINPAIDSNQIRTDRLTCTTSAIRKKSISGVISWIAGVLARTRSNEKSPAPTRDAIASSNQALAVLRALSL